MPPVGRCVSVLAIIAALLAAVPAAVGAHPDGLSDIESSVHKPAIDALDELGLFEGTLCGEDTFCPSGTIDRSTMAVWLIRALEDEEPPALEGSRFDDVDAALWWAPHVERIAELGVTVGCRTEPLRYCPDQSVTRGQMATFLVRAFDLAPAGPAGFTDTAGSVHESHINALAAARITAGCRTEPLQYCPEQSVTRGQMATFLARALGILEVPGEEPQPAAGSGEVQPRAAYIDVAAGAGHYCALRADGTVECWGSYHDHVTGQHLEDVEQPEGTFSSVSAGYNHMCGLRTDGTATCWGANTEGQARPPFARVGFSAIDAGNHHSCGLGVNGSITCWGANGDGQAVSQAGRSFIAVDAGIWHTCALRRNGSIHCWGSNHFRQINAPTQGSFTAVAAGALHTCALRTNGTVTCWGTNNSGGYVGQTDAPRGTFTAISAGGWNTCGLRTDGSVECWGYLRDAAEDATARTDIPAGTYTDVSAGWSFACAINDQGGVVCFQ